MTTDTLYLWRISNEPVVVVVYFVIFAATIGLAVYFQKKGKK